MELPSCTGRRSAAVIKYDAGPRPDPCMTLARMLANVDNSGALKMTDMKLQDMKLTDRVAGHEIAGHENGGPNSRT